MAIPQNNISSCGAPTNSCTVCGQADPSPQRAVTREVRHQEFHPVGQDEAALNRLFDELSFGGMLRQRCLRL